MTRQRTLQILVVTVISAVTLAVGSVAGAIDNPDYTAPPPTTPVTQALPTVVQTARQTPRTPAVPVSSRPRMPVTGSDLVQLLAMGAALVVGGAGILTLRRRQTT